MRAKSIFMSSSSGSVRSGTIITLHPARYALVTPLGESSTAKVFSGDIPNVSHA